MWLNAVVGIGYRTQRLQILRNMLRRLPQARSALARRIAVRNVSAMGYMYYNTATGTRYTAQSVPIGPSIQSRLICTSVGAAAGLLATFQALASEAPELPSTPSKSGMQGAALKRLLRLLPSEAVLAADALAAADAALADDWSSTDAGALALALTVNLMAQELLDKPAYGRDVTQAASFAPVGPEELLDLLRFARYSDAVYHPDAASLAQHCSASVEEVVLPPRRPMNDSLAPHYAVVVDHARREIVLTIRGTASITDLITDACGYPAHVILGGDSKEGSQADERKRPLLRRAAAAVRTSFQRLRQGAMGEHEHHAHSGVARGAVSILIDAAPIIDELTQRLPKYSVSITGHSLGAGAAALCATLVNAPCHAGTIAILMPSSETERTEPLSEGQAAKGSSCSSAEDGPGVEIPEWVPSKISKGVQGLFSAAKRNTEQAMADAAEDGSGISGQQSRSEQQHKQRGGKGGQGGGSTVKAATPEELSLSKISSEDDVVYTAWKNDALIEAVRTWRVALCRAHGSGATSHDSGRAALDGEHALRAVVFAAPACVTPRLSQLARSTTTCLIHGDDMVPRLRLGALMQLRADMASLEWKDDIVQLIPAIKQRWGAAGKLLDLSVSALNSTQRGGAKVASTADWLDRELTQWQAHVQARENKRQENDKADAHGMMLRTASGFVPPGRLLQMSYGSSEARSSRGPFKLLGTAAQEGAAEDDSDDPAADAADAIKTHLQDFVGNSAEDDVPKMPFSVDRLISSAVAGVKELEGLVGVQGGERRSHNNDSSPPQPPRPLHVTEVPADTQVGDVLRTLVVSRHMLSDHLILGTCHALEHALLQAQRKPNK